jgi:hypothetical protein
MDEIIATVSKKINSSASYAKLYDILVKLNTLSVEKSFINYIKYLLNCDDTRPSHILIYSSDEDPTKAIKIAECLAQIMILVGLNNEMVVFGGVRNIMIDNYVGWTYYKTTSFFDEHFDKIIILDNFDYLVIGEHDYFGMEAISAVNNKMDNFGPIIFIANESRMEKNIFNIAPKFKRHINLICDTCNLCEALRSNKLKHVKQHINSTNIESFNETIKHHIFPLGKSSVIILDYLLSIGVKLSSKNIEKIVALRNKFTQRTMLKYCTYWISSNRYFITPYKIFMFRLYGCNIYNSDLYTIEQYFLPEL